MKIENKKYDIIVIGAGSAGIGAALSAARSGASTLLIEKLGFVGGTTTASLVNHWDPIHLMEIAGVAAEIYHKLKAQNALLDFPVEKVEMPFSFWEAGCGFDSEIYKQIVTRMLKDAGVSMLFHSQVVGVNQNDGNISGVKVQTKTGILKVEGKVFIDATGDGDLAYYSGAPYKKGTPEGELMSTTLCFTLEGVDEDKVIQYFKENPDDFANHPRIGKIMRSPEKSIIWQGFNKIIEKARAAGDLTIPLPEPGIGMARLPKAGQVHINGTRTNGIDGTDSISLSEGELDQREKIEHLFKFIKEYLPGFEKSYISQIAPVIGIRETRRIECEHYLTMKEWEDDERFKDSIVEGKWAHCDIHSGKSMRWDFKLFEGPFQIPYRCLLPLKTKNLLVAGRCISTDREVNGTVRIQPLCMVTGQAAGTAAAHSVNSGNPLRKIDINKLRKDLKEQNINC